MAGQSFSKRLVREFQRGGKKSIVLALLLVVGLCIWGPMLWRKIFPKQDAAATIAPASKSNPAKDQAGQLTAAASTSDAPDIEWKSLHRRLEDASLIQPVSLDEIVRDPFDREWFRAKKKPVVAKPEIELPPEGDPLRNLELTAVFAGPDGGAAVINDLVFRIGEEVPPEGPIRYVVKEIRKDRVLLERSGKLEEIPLKGTILPNKKPVDQTNDGPKG
jgi:hypothetical protein